MANYASLKAAIQQVVKTNGNNEITGALLQQSLLSLINSLGADYQFCGVATPSTTPGTPDQNVAYLAGPGTYSNFGSFVVNPGYLGVLKYNGSWSLDTVVVGKDYDGDIEDLNQRINALILELTGTVTTVNNFSRAGSFKIFSNLNLKNGIGYRFNVSSTNANTGGAVYLTIKDANGNTIHNAMVISTGGTSGNTTFTPSADYENAYVVLGYNTASPNVFTITILATGFTDEIDGRKMATLHYGLPMIDKLNTTFSSITSNGRTLTPRVLSNFLLDVHFVGTPQTGCKYRIRSIQYAKSGSASYANAIIVDRLNSDSTYTNLAIYQLGANAPVGVHTYSIDLSGDTGVTKCLVRVDWDALAEIESGSTSYSTFVLVNNGYVFDQTYIFGNTGYIALVEILNNAIGGKDLALLHNGLPMIDRINSTFANITSQGRTLTPRVLSNFLLDVHFVGTPQTGCKYRLKAFQYAKNGSASYANDFVIDRVNADSSTTTLKTEFIGATAPSGLRLHEISLDNDTGVTKCYILANWDAMTEIDPGATQYSIFNLANNGYVYDQNYLFANLGPVSQIIKTVKLEQDVAELQAESGVSSLELVLPNLIYAIAGTELYLFNDTVALSADKGLQSPINYVIRWSCSKGTITERGFRYTPDDADVGSNIVCSCSLYTNNFALVEQKNFTIKVLAKNALNTAKNIVYFGDSLGSSAATALYQRFHNNNRFTGTIPQMLGTRGTTIKYEAVGGYRWLDYATRGTHAYRVNVTGVSSVSVGSVYSITISGTTTNVTIREVNLTGGTGNLLVEASYGAAISNFPSTGTLVFVSGTGDASIPFTNGMEESGNPLWNDQTNQLDVAQYKTLVGLSANDKIDAVSFQFGINDTFDAATITGYIVALYNAFMADNPNCKFIVGLTTISGNTADGYGANYGAGGNGTVTYKKRIQNFKKLYLSLVGSAYPNLRIATPGLQVDRYFGYTFGERQISQEYTQTEQYHNNFVHPGGSGYNQMGDAYLAAFVAALTE